MLNIFLRKRAVCCDKSCFFVAFCILLCYNEVNNVLYGRENMKEMTKNEEKKVYKILKILFLSLAILLFTVVENYFVVQLFKKQEVAVQDLSVTCEQTTEGKYYVSTEYGYVNVYNGTGRNIKDLKLTVHYVTASGKSASSYEVQAGDFEPYMVDGKFNAYQLSFRFEPKSDLLSDTQIVWLEFEVESYDVETVFLDYLMIGGLAIAFVSLFMYWNSKKTYNALVEGEATSVAVIGEEEQAE